MYDVLFEEASYEEDKFKTEFKKMLDDTVDEILKEFKKNCSEELSKMDFTKVLKKNPKMVIDAFHKISDVFHTN